MESLKENNEKIAVSLLDLFDQIFDQDHHLDMTVR